MPGSLHARRSPGATPGRPGRPAFTPALPPLARAFLQELTSLALLAPEAVALFLVERGDRLAEYSSDTRLGSALVEAGLLTPYQLERALAGRGAGLILGNYRVLDRIGGGGMGEVYLAEHRLMKRLVAIKVVPFDGDCHAALRERFYAEMRLLAELNHPHVVQAYDAGEMAPNAPNAPSLSYLVMERAAGGDLEAHVRAHGPASIARACEWIGQAAQGLQAAHDLHLIHRDLKPSNLLLTEDGQVKLVDFGLARTFSSQLTDPRALLGSVEFMAPEQSHDPSAVGAAADVYGLGATLFWLLTGEPPYPLGSSLGAALRMLQSQPPRRLRHLRPDVPAALDELTAGLMARDPDRRPSPALSVCTALAAFTAPPGREPSLTFGCRTQFVAELASGVEAGPRVLIVDDEASVRQLLRQVVESMGCKADLAVDGEAALALAAQHDYAAALLDVRLPGMNGYEVGRRLRLLGRATPRIILLSGAGEQNELTEALFRGADDCLVKPFGIRQLQARLERLLRQREQDDRLRDLVEHHQRSSRQLQQSLQARTADLRQAHDALLFAMARMAESHDGETAGHLRRLARYSVALAQQAAQSPPWRGLVNASFLDQLERCAPLHDIGKIGLPDELLLKPASLTTAERAMMETHTLIGDRILEGLSREHGEALDFMGMARGIVRHHHEHYDGRGYPDRLVGMAIPASARLVALADVYDALRRQRLHKPAMSHASTMRLMLGRGASQFDPTLLAAFETCQGDFERIFREISE